MMRRIGHVSRGGLLVLLGFLLGGCGTHHLESARSNFYMGQYDRADANLEKVTGTGLEKALVLMERGMIRQAKRNYAGSVQDWLAALDEFQQLETRSASKQAASMVVNDSVLDFRGAPYEQTLVHAFLAQSYLAMSMWDDAAVEGRRAVLRLQDLNGYPDDAFTRYLAGFTMELIGDRENAAVQYRVANGFLKGVEIEENGGRLRFADTNAPAGASRFPPPVKGSELVCFVLIGQSPGHPGPSGAGLAASRAPYAEIYADGRLLGRSYPLASTADLLAATERRTATLKTVKTAVRVGLKVAVAEAIHQSNSALGDLALMALMAAEQPDQRRWETLPLWLEAARVPCPDGLKSYDVVFRDAGGFTRRRIRIQDPITVRRQTYVSFCRDMPPYQAPASPPAVAPAATAGESR